MILILIDSSFLAQSIRPALDDTVVLPLIQPVVTTGWYDRFVPKEAPTTLSTAVIGKKIWADERREKRLKRRRRKARRRKKMLEQQRKAQQENGEGGVIGFSLIRMFRSWRNHFSDDNMPIVKGGKSDLELRTTKGKQPKQEGKGRSEMAAEKAAEEKEKENARKAEKHVQFM